MCVRLLHDNEADVTQMTDCPLTFSFVYLWAPTILEEFQMLTLVPGNSCIRSFKALSNLSNHYIWKILSIKLTARLTLIFLNLSLFFLSLFFLVKRLSASVFESGPASEKWP